MLVGRVSWVSFSVVGFYTFMHTPLPQLPLAYNQFSWTDWELISERVIGILDSSFFLIAFFCEVLHYGEVRSGFWLKSGHWTEDQWWLRGDASFPSTLFYSHKVSVLKTSKYEQGKYMFWDGSQNSQTAWSHSLLVLSTWEHVQRKASSNF